MPKCNLCSQDSGSARCKPCGSVAVRVSKIMKSYDSEYVNKWRSAMSNPIDKTEFYATAQTTFGPDLEKLMKHTVTETVSDETQVEFKGTGNFMDLVELTEKYKTRPKRLEAIKKNARQISCPVYETTLFEDMLYVSTSTDTQKRSLVHEREGSVQEKVKRARVPKPEGEGVKKNTEPTIELDGPGIEIVNKMKEKLQTHIQKIGNMITAIEAEGSKEWSDLLPSYLLRGMKATQTEIQSTDTMFDMAISNARANMKELKSILFKNTTDTRAWVKRFDVQKTEAMSFTKC